MSLRVIFCGTPEFAVPNLNALVHSPHTVTSVVTVPDRPQGRGRQSAPSSIKVLALKLGLPLHQPERLDDPEFLRSVQEEACDLLVVVAFRILPVALFESPRLGAMNLHASLLPAYRGAAPVERALMEGCRETGVTTFKIARRVDEGGILLQRRVDVEPEENAGSLAGRLAEIGSQLVLDTLAGLEAGTLVPTPQDDALATRAPKITADDRPIRWDQPAEVSHHRVRALSPRPGAVARRQGQQLKVLESGFDLTATTALPGEVLQTDHPRGIAVGTGRGILFLQHVQPEGKKAMAAAAYVRGNPLKPGDRFE
jgi:methionyl-tRNA formyltransferase